MRRSDRPRRAIWRWRMRRLLMIGILALAAPGAALLAGMPSPDWAMNATVIEACSCPMFCQCYFNAEPANHAGPGHEGHRGASGATHFCRANNAYRINKGHYGTVSLD